MPDEETLEELRAEAQEYSGSYHGGIIAAYNRAVENAARIEHWLRAPATPFDYNSQTAHAARLANRLLDRARHRVR
jgi:hypothetical protein